MMEKVNIAQTVITSLVGILGTISIVGIRALINGQRSMTTEAKEGRRDIHLKIDGKFDTLHQEQRRHSDRLTKLETCHKVNHGEQL
jgi:hypothetical protein